MVPLSRRDFRRDFSVFLIFPYCDDLKGGAIAQLQLADHMEVVFSGEFPLFVHPELKAFVETFGVRIGYIHKEADAIAAYPTSLLAHGFDQLPPKSSALAIAIHAHSIQIILVRFSFCRNPIFRRTRL